MRCLILLLYSATLFVAAITRRAYFRRHDYYDFHCCLRRYAAVTARHMLPLLMRHAVYAFADAITPYISADIA